MTGQLGLTPFLPLVWQARWLYGPDIWTTAMARTITGAIFDCAAVSDLIAAAAAILALHAL